MTAGDEGAAWAASGAMFLTGRPDGPPLGPPEGFVGRLRAVGEALGRSSGRLGRRVDVDVLALLGERAALSGLRRGGDVSCGGSARLLRTADGWLAVNLPRPDDLDLLPAWLAEIPYDPILEPAGGADGLDHPDRDGDPERITHSICGQSARALAGEASVPGENETQEPTAGPEEGAWAAPSGAGTQGGTGGQGPGGWAALAAAVARGSAEALAERAGLLGLPVAALPRHPPAVTLASGPLAGLPVVASRIGAAGVEAAGAGPARGTQGLFVADLSSLWAGPLCAHLLQLAGARVVKVESLHRPDGARSGPAAFFDLLHGGQEAVALDFRDEPGRAALRRLLASADVVVEGSRPRALEQLGIEAEALLGEAAASGAGPRVWVSITGYGRAAPGRDRVAFGDDAAAAGGLVVWDEAGPCFLADAVADPCAGMVAAAAVLGALAGGGRWLLDVSMRDVAAHLAGPRSGPSAAPPPSGLVAAPARARAASGRGPRLGEHTEALPAELRRR
ncbi:MAG TPA: CoA transferase [Acidimicrobiia bacterium]|nr:CoA transferase [Acidimicrobiia bacterium]HKN92223.1 CoA transferase [Acidimicrobiia bacterium]